MIIKLIQPKMSVRPMDTSLKTRMSPHLGLFTLASVLRKNHTVLLENENIRPICWEDQIDLVGITVTVDTFKRAARIAEKYHKNGILVIAGGIHISACPDSCSPYFDAICIGPSELLWPQIVLDVIGKKLKKRYVCPPSMKGSDIATPAYDMIDHKEYLYDNILFTSYGCPFCCEFCYNSCHAYKGLYINKPVKKVLEEIRLIGKKHIMFVDDNFIGNPKWTLSFVRALRPMKIKWNAAVSANIVNMPELMDEMKLSGCQSLFIGFESLSEPVLSKANKKQNQVTEYERLVYELHKRDIMINASFVFGLDEENASVFQNTIDWVVQQKIETVTSHILTPYPGTKVYDALIQQNRITCHDFSKYTTSHVVFKPQNMTQQELYEGYLRIYREIYSLRNIRKRMPFSVKRIIPYLLFNLGYRKFGKVTEKICHMITYEKLGLIAAKLSRYHRNS